MSVTPGLLSLPGMQVFAVCCVVLVLKMTFLAIYTVLLRRRAKAYRNPEDAARVDSEAVTAEDPVVERVLRAHRNDMENVLPFFVIGLLYVLGGASARGATIYAVVFTVSRIFHGWFYLGGLQPWRSLSYAIGLLCVLGMTAQVAMRALGVG